METTIIEALFLPWWKIIAYIGAIVLAVIAIRVTVNFDVNIWLESRRNAKAIKEWRKAAMKCRHVWTLYSSSPYSQCSLCRAVISTQSLLLSRGNPEVLIGGQVYNVQVTPGEGAIFVNNPYGNIPR